MFAFSIIFQLGDDAERLNPCSCKTMSYLSYIVNTMAADDLAVQVARTSAAMALM